MKITGVKTTLYVHRLSQRMGDANSPSGRVKGANCMVELETDEGLVGIGLGGGGVRPQIQGLVDGLLKGQDPRRGNFPFPRRKGAGPYVKGLEPGEVKWRG